MKEKILFTVYIFLVLLVIPLGIYFLAMRQHIGKKQTIGGPTPTISLKQTVSPVITKAFIAPTVTPAVSKDQFYQELLTKLPLSGTITTKNNVSVDYALSHTEGDSNNTISIDVTNINFQVSQSGQDACEKDMANVSTDQQNLQYWCDYNYNKENFLFVAQYIFTTYLPQGTTFKDYNFLWGNRDYIQQQATVWLKDLQ